MKKKMRISYGYFHRTSRDSARSTRHNSADSVPTSDLLSIKEVAIRTTLSHTINISWIFYYACSLVFDIQCTRYKNAFNNRF